MNCDPPDDGDLPEDPFPNLTLVRLEQLKLGPDLAYLEAVQRLFPGSPLVLLAEVVERTPAGAPHLVRIIP